jgi:response regulator RpfG family c-di-GMP phosphodiesterase/serine/threonine protein kinase
MSRLLSRTHGRTVYTENLEGLSAADKVRSFLEELLCQSIVLPEDWQALEGSVRHEIQKCTDRNSLLEQLRRHGLLTEYQVGRCNAGNLFGLVLGSYRVLDRLGAGGMAVVFKAEHIDMRHLVAIKVLPLTSGQDTRLQGRFMAEMRSVARLRHPNIVAAMDAGRLSSADPDQPVLQYLVMEYVPGQDLEEHVNVHGPLSPPRACNLVHQIASALAETHKFQLVHRDVKPSNIIVTPEDQAKLLDFGLARSFDARMTQAGTLLGTIDFMAPEQAKDASTADIRADIYGLGGTLYWCLTGKLPFPIATKQSAADGLLRRLNQAPPSVRATFEDIPAELDGIVQRMMAVEPKDRFATPQAVMRAMLPFLKGETVDHAGMQPGLLERGADVESVIGSQRASHVHRVLIVDDEPSIRDFCKAVLNSEGMACTEVGCGLSALEAITSAPYDLVLLDVNMPNLSGLEVLKRLREKPPTPHLKVIMFSGMSTSDEMAKMLLNGADDFITKPFSIVQLQCRAQTALRLKDTQDRVELLAKHLLAVNAKLEGSLESRDSDLVHSRSALVLALAKLVEQRNTERSSHLVRLQRYCRCLADKAATLPTFASQIDNNFAEMLECCAPLHDIGRVGLPDHILLKPGKLTDDERILMQAHTTIGADTLNEVARLHGSAMAFLHMAIDITRHHHERFDGTGYPDRLAGSAIPLAARIVAICDVYDALRSRRVYKPALSHAASVQLMTEASPGHFDPALLQAFVACGSEFDRIFTELPD